MLDGLDEVIVSSENNSFDIDGILILRKCREIALQESIATKTIQKLVADWFNVTALIE